MADGPRTIDLFCGAGGLSEGFRQAGFQVGLGLDFDEDACRTHRLNHPGTTVLCADAREVSSQDLLAGSGFSEVDVIIGGPSCQGFSTQGRRNRWASDEDPRNLLYREFARVVSELRPEWFVLENVPGLLWFDSGSFSRRIFTEFERHGYTLTHKVVLAADLGVPQLRRRLLVVGTRTGRPFVYPQQTHMGSVRRDTVDLWEARRLTEFPHLDRHRSLWDAIGDLPALGVDGGTEVAAYGRRKPGPYQSLMRDGGSVLFDHQSPPLPGVHRDLVKHVAEGQTWREIPVEHLPARFARIRRTDGTNLFARPERGRASYTITTQFNNVTTGAYTHPLQHRALSAREGARIQSFPDWYRFTGSLAAKYRQIGNAVPPMMAHRVGAALLEAMGFEGASDPGMGDVGQLDLMAAV